MNPLISVKQHIHIQHSIDKNVKHFKNQFNLGACGKRKVPIAVLEKGNM
jgi:hypothetical protein